MNLSVFHGFVIHRKDVAGRFGLGSVGYMLGSSRPCPTGLSAAAAAVTISISSSTLPCTAKAWVAPRRHRGETQEEKARGDGGDRGRGIDRRRQTDREKEVYPNCSLAATTYSENPFLGRLVVGLACEPALDALRLEQVDVLVVLLVLGRLALLGLRVLVLRLLGQPQDALLGGLGQLGEARDVNVDLAEVVVRADQVIVPQLHHERTRACACACEGTGGIFSEGLSRLHSDSGTLSVLTTLITRRAISITFI